MRTRIRHHRQLRKPELETELVLGSNADLLHKLKRNAIAAALIAVPDPNPDVESIPQFDDEVFFAAPKGLSLCRHDRSRPATGSWLDSSVGV
jgi:hypothetical protein